MMERTERKRAAQGSAPVDGAPKDRRRPDLEPGHVRNLPRSNALAAPMDELNQSIVKMLQVDGRMPFREIAKRLDVSEGTIRNRVSWMKKHRVLRIVAVADPTAIDYRADAMLGVKVAPGSSPREVGERLALESDVVYILWVSGRYDLLVEIVCETHEDFLEFVSEKIYKKNDISSIETMSGLNMIKNQFLLKWHIP